MTTTFDAVKEAEILLAIREDKIKQAVLVEAIEHKRQFDAAVKEHHAEIEAKLAKANELEKLGINIGNAIALSALSEMEKQLDEKMATILDEAAKARTRLNELTKQGRRE